MTNRIFTIRGRLRQDLAACLTAEALEAAVRQAGHTWRKRVLDPVATIDLFLLQILHGNTAGQHVVHFRQRNLHRVATGKLLRSATAPLRTHDLEAGDVVLGDRGFSSSAHIAR